MVNRRPPSVDALLFALSDPTRVAIVDQLARHGPRRVGELTMPRKLSPAAVAKHLRVLESAGLLSQKIDGRTRLCRLHLAPLRRAGAWLVSLAGDDRSASTPRGDPPPAEIRQHATIRSRNRAVLERIFGEPGADRVER
jgi:DNA-binding transcriptional ArsR family regulator